MVDKRHEDARFPVASFEFAAQTFPPTANNSLAPTIGKINGRITAIDIVTTDTEDGITYTVTITNANGATIFSEAALVDNTSHRRGGRSEKVTQDADFNIQPVASEELTATILPSAPPDAGDVGSKIATVTVTIYVE